MMIFKAMNIFAAIGDTCQPSTFAKNFLGFPHWYDYLGGVQDAQGQCVPKMSALSDVWLVVAAVLDILLRVAGIVAVFIVIYGAAMYITSQGEPDKVLKAKNTIVNALIGLALAVMASATIAFIAGSIH